MASTLRRRSANPGNPQFQDSVEPNLNDYPDALPIPRTNVPKTLLRADLVNLPDADYCKTVMDPVLRPLIHELTLRMPADALVFTDEWLKSKPLFRVGVGERER